MKALKWIVLILVLVGVYALYRYLSDTINCDRFRQDVDKALGQNFSANDQQIQKCIIELAANFDVEPNEIQVAVKRWDKAGGDPVAHLISPAFPSVKTTILEARVHYTRPLLVFDIDYDFSVEQHRSSATNPHKNAIDEAMKALAVPGR